MRRGRPKGGRNKIAREHKCKDCSIDLVAEENWYASMVGRNYQCIECKKLYIKQFRSESEWLVQYKKDNKEKYDKSSQKQRIKEGIGVYQVMLGNICLYVGQGQLKDRKDRHLKYSFTSNSKVYSYCLKHNINRKLLSFNVLEYEDDKTRMEQLEDWYITFLTPVINPKPTLGLYVL